MCLLKWMWRQQGLKHKSIISRGIFRLYGSNNSFVFLNNKLTKRQCHFKLLSENICMLLTCFLSRTMPLSQLLKISQYKWGTCYFLDNLCTPRLWEGQIEEPNTFSDGLWIKAPADQQTCLSWFGFVFSCPVWSCLFINVHPDELHQMFNNEGIYWRWGRHMSRADCTWLVLADNCSPTK